MSSTSVSALVLRGSPHRKTNFMEEFQKAYLAAIAAAAGCTIGAFNVDDGIDAQLNHKSDAHTQLPDRTARLELQLKATHQQPAKSGAVSIQMARDRWDYYRTANPTIHKIVVILHMPNNAADWIKVSSSKLEMYHCSYWTNLAHSTPSNAERPTVVASAGNIFDDTALCEIMAKIGQGGAP